MSESHAPTEGTHGSVRNTKDRTSSLHAELDGLITTFRKGQAQLS